MTVFDAELDRLIDDMIDTMYAAPGIGLAAPQVGVAKRVCVIDLSVGKKGGELLILINPEFVERDGMQLEDEGCLSVPGFTATVARPARAVVRALDRTGQNAHRSKRTACWRAPSSTKSTISMDAVPRPVARTEARHDHAPHPQAAAHREVVMPLRVVFFGTPAFAVPSLLAMAATAHPVVAVVTQPDRPRGRGQKVSPVPVKDAAAQLGLPILQPDRLKDAASATLRASLPTLASWSPTERFCRPSCRLPRLGMINVHASLLPRWRGAAPIHRAIIAGDRVTGITIMRVVPALDAGPMLARSRAPIGPEETSVELESRLAALGADLV